MITSACGTSTSRAITRTEENNVYTLGLELLMAYSTRMFESHPSCIRHFFMCRGCQLKGFESLLRESWQDHGKTCDYLALPAAASTIKTIVSM